MLVLFQRLLCQSSAPHSHVFPPSCSLHACLSYLYQTRWLSLCSPSLDGCSAVNDTLQAGTRLSSQPQLGRQERAAPVHGPCPPMGSGTALPGQLAGSTGSAGNAGSTGSTGSSLCLLASPGSPAFCQAKLSDAGGASSVHV